MNEGTIGRWVLVAAGIVVIATIVAAISVMGLPSAQRDQQLDQRRVQDLRRIVEAVDSYVATRRSLPPNLQALASQPGRSLSIVDPVDGSPYAYEVIDARAFRLCAAFATDTAAYRQDDGPWLEDRWLHGAGRQCFDRKPGDRARKD
jgi:hypothetical protein